MGVSKVYVVDIMPKRLEKAMQLGATGIINGKEEDAVAKIMELTEGKGCDLAIETAGTEITTAQLIKMAKKGSTLVLVGYNATETIKVPINVILDKELTIKSVFRYRNIYPLAIESVAQGAVKIKDIVTNIYSLDQIQEGLTECAHNKADIVKAVIKI